MPFASFDELGQTPAARAALASLREVTGETGGPMERHALRCHHVASELARRRGWTVDAEVLMIAAMLHDLGLYDGASRGGVYVHDGAVFARELLAPFGWDEARITLCADAIERHHELRRQLDRGAEVEALRRADLVEVSNGLVRFGLDRAWWGELGRAVSRKGLNGEITRMVGHALRERPLTLPRIFLR